FLKVFAQAQSELFVTSHRDYLVPQHILVGEHQPASTFQRLSRQSLHWGCGYIWFVERNNPVKCSGLGLVGRGQDYEITNGHNLVNYFSTWNELKVMGKPFPFQHLQLLAVVIVVGLVVGISHGSSGQKVPVISGPVKDFGMNVFPHGSQDVPSLV